MAFGFIRLLCITTHKACQWPMGASEDRGLEQAGTLGARHETVTALFFCQDYLSLRIFSFRLKSTAQSVIPLSAQAEDGEAPVRGLTFSHLFFKLSSYLYHGMITVTALFFLSRISLTLNLLFVFNLQRSNTTAGAGRGRGGAR